MTQDQPVPEPDAEPRLVRDARTVASGLRGASLALAVPAALVTGGAAVAFVVHTIMSAVALGGGMTVVRWVWLGLALVGLAVTVLFAARVVATLRASRDPDALGGELVRLVDLSAVTTAVLADLTEVTSREGGIRVASRARALWRMLRRLSVEEHVSSFERARWFLPPDVTLTWALAQVVTWSGLVAWVLVPVAILGRVGGWL